MTQKDSQPLVSLTVSKTNLGWMLEAIYDEVNELSGENEIFFILSDDLSEIVSIITKATALEDFEDIRKYFYQFCDDGGQHEIPFDKPDGKALKK